MFLGPAGHLGAVVLASGGSGGSMQTVQHQRKWKGERVFETQQREDHQSPPAMEMQAVSMPAIKVSRTSENWKHGC